MPHRIEVLLKYSTPFEKDFSFRKMSIVAVVSNSSQKVTGLEENCLEKRTQADFKDLWSFSAKKKFCLRH